MKLTKYEQKDFELIRIIAERGKLNDARLAGARWIAKAGDNMQARNRRTEAANRLLGAFRPAGGGYGGVRVDRRS